MICQKKRNKLVYSKNYLWLCKCYAKNIPDPFIFCAILTFLVFLGSLTFTKQSPLDIIAGMEVEVLVATSFSMQMALVLVAGHAMASSPIIKRFLSNIASKIKSPKQFIIIVSFH